MSFQKPSSLQSGVTNQSVVNDLEPELHLPNRYHAGEPLPKGIIGAKILRFGAAPATADLEGGGLVIDYIPQGKRKVFRVVLSFTELGMWVTALEELPLSKTGTGD